MHFGAEGGSNLAGSSRHLDHADQFKLASLHNKMDLGCVLNGMPLGSQETNPYHDDDMCPAFRSSLNVHELQWCLTVKAVPRTAIPQTPKPTAAGSYSVMGAAYGLLPTS